PPLASGPGQHPVLARHPSAPAAPQPRRHRLLDHRRADDAGAPGLDQGAAVRRLDEPRRDLDRAKLVRLASIGSHARTLPAGSARPGRGGAGAPGPTTITRMSDTPADPAPPPPGGPHAGVPPRARV